MRHAVLLLCCLGLACGGSAPATVAPALGSAEAAPTAAPVPDTVAIELAALMPATVDLFAAAPGTRELEDAFSQIVEGRDVLDGLGRGIAAELAASPRAVTQVLRNIDGVALGLRLDATGVIMLRTTDVRGVDTLLAHPGLERRDGRYAVVGSEAQIAWYPARRLLYLGMSEVLDEVDEVLAGRAPALGSDRTFAAGVRRFEPDPALNVWGDLPRLLEVNDVDVDARSPLHAAATLGDAVSLRVEAAMGAGAVDRELFAPPVPLDLAAELPGGTVGFVSYSLATDGSPARRGAILHRGLEAVDRGLANALTEAGTELGAEGSIDLDDVLGALGDQGTVGMVMSRRVSPTFVVRQHLRDPAIVATILDALRRALAAEGTPIRDLPQGFAWTSREDEVAAARIVGDQLVVAVGQAAAEVVTDAGPTLGEDQAYQRTRGQLAQSHLAVWLNAARVVDALGDETPDDEVATLLRTAGKDRAIGVMTLVVEPIDDAFRLRAKLHDAASLGVASAVLIYSVRRYLAASKASEAKALTASIARAAVHAREKTGRWCDSATPVPAEVPHGQRYAPSRRPGEDFASGDERTGWSCLGFSVAEPHYYQYRYRQGASYVGPSRGGPDPGPDGFEVSAVGDLDADGETSLFTVAGQVDPKTGRITLRQWAVDELE